MNADYFLGGSAVALGCVIYWASIIEQFRQSGVVHEAYAGDRQRSVEELRADLSHVLTGMLHQRELEACLKAVGTPDKNSQTTIR